MLVTWKEFTKILKKWNLAVLKIMQNDFFYLQSVWA